MKQIDADDYIIKNTPAWMINNRTAVRAAKEAANFGQDAMSGGFDIVKKLFIKQHKKQKTTPSKKV
jgi:hypothetical protein